MARELTGASVITQMLEESGVTHLFFVPAILKRTFVEVERTTDIKRILVHTEKGAAYMADGFARASGRVGICLCQLVGAANLAAGLKDAALACSPVIAITGGPSEASRGRSAYQQIDDYSMFRAVTKFSARVDSVDRFPDLFRQAVRTALVGKPGPVHLELASRTAVAIDSASTSVGPLVDDQFGSSPPFRPAPDARVVADAVDRLRHARRPVIVAGGGVRTSRAERELAAFAEALAIPVATSLNGKDVLPSQHPLALGPVGLYSRPSANRAVLESDLVFFIGSQTGGQVTLDWEVPPMGTDVVQLDIDPAELGRHYPNRVSLLCDARTGLVAMLEALNGERRHPSAWLEHVQALAREWHATTREFAESEAQPLRPERVCAELTNALPDDAVFVADTGHAGVWSSAYMDLLHPTQSYIRAAGSLGWAVPAAIGAKLAVGDRPVVGFTGDGGFWYHIAEIETAVRLALNVVILVNNNHSLNQEAPSWADAYGGRLSGSHAEVWQFTDLDFAKVADALGATGIRVRKPGALPLALEQALSLHGPAVIDVVTDPAAIAPPPLTARDLTS